MRLFLLVILLIVPLHVFAEEGGILTPKQVRYLGKKYKTYDILKYSGQHALFVRALELTEMDKKLKSNESWTVMAPTDKAWAELQRHVVYDLFAEENRENLLGFVNHHILRGTHFFGKDFPPGRTLHVSFNGNEITMVRDYYGIMMNGVYMKALDVKTQNGVVSFIDRVVAPKIDPELVDDRMKSLFSNE